MMLTKDRRRRLDALGFVWDVVAQKWEEGFNSLKKYKDREGNCRIPTNHIEDEYRLGAWVSGLRNKKENLLEDRRRR